MTVEELIKKLESFPTDAEVWIEADCQWYQLTTIACETSPIKPFNVEVTLS